MAEGVRFELTVGYKPTLVFKTSAFNRSASPPEVFISIISIVYIFLLKLFVFIDVYKFMSLMVQDATGKRSG